MQIMKNLKEKARQIKKDTAALFIAMKMKETPWIARIMAGITIGYALSPIDLIPDFIPVLGYMDDLIVLPVLILITLRLIPQEVMKRARQEAECIWVDGWPKKWYWGLPVVTVWLLAAGLILRAVFQH